jgi:hypothetical protein
MLAIGRSPSERAAQTVETLAYRAVAVLHAPIVQPAAPTNTAKPAKPAGPPHRVLVNHAANPSCPSDTRRESQPVRTVGQWAAL